MSELTEEDEVSGISRPIDYYKYSDGNWQKSSTVVPREVAFTIFVNNQELVTTLCTPIKLNCLVLGYLISEKVIQEVADVERMRVCESESLADVQIKRADFVLPNKRILTSGCGGGVSLSNSEPEKISSSFSVTPPQISNLMKQLLEDAELYRIAGGIHTSVLCDNNKILIKAEDIGRHNTLDKILGESRLIKQSTTNKIICTTGRLSSEMVLKIARMEVPVVASLTSPTERALELAQKLGITLIGYATGTHFSAYSCPERLLNC